MSNRKIVANASWIMVGRVFQLGLTFITTMLVTRYLGPAEFGKLNYIYSYIQLFLPLCTMGMNDIVVKQLVDNRDKNDEILGTMIVIRLTASLVSMACSVLLVNAFNGREGYVLIAVLQSFSLLFQSFDCIMYFYQSRLLSRKSGTVYALAYILSSVFRIAGIILKKDIRWFAFAMSLDYIMIAILLLRVYLSDGHRFGFSFRTAKDLLRKSYHYIFAGILIVIYGKVTDVLLLGKMVDETTVGYYSAATTLCNAWPFVLTAIIDSLSPVIIDTFKTDEDRFKTKIRQLYALVFYISLAVAAAIVPLAGFIIMTLYGADYSPAVVPLRIFAFSTIFSYLGVARTSWMQCRKMTRYEVYISLFGAVTNIILNYILIQRYGIAGAAAAAVLTQFLTNFIFLFAMRDTRENAKLILDAIMLKGISDKEDNANVQE